MALISIVLLFDALAAVAHTLEVVVCWDSQPVFTAGCADGRPTFKAVMLLTQDAEVGTAYVACADFSRCEYRPRANFKALDPFLIGTQSGAVFSIDRERDKKLYLFVSVLALHILSLHSKPQMVASFLY